MKNETPEQFADRIPRQAWTRETLTEAVRIRDRRVRSEALRAAQERLAADGGVKPVGKLTQSELVTWRIAVLACCKAIHELEQETP